MTRRIAAVFLGVVLCMGCGRPDRLGKNSPSPVAAHDSGVLVTPTADTSAAADSAPITPPEIVIHYEGDSSPGDPFAEVIHGLDFAWEEGTALNPVIWFEAGEYHMLYIAGRASFALGYAHSPDGLNWKKSPQPAITAPARTDGVQAPMVLPGTNLVFAYAYGGAPAARGIYAWRRSGSGFQPEASIRPARMIDYGSAQNSLYPGNVVKHGGRYILYSHGAENGRSTIFRSTSPDGVGWSRAEAVLLPGASGFDRGTVSEACAYYDESRREWTLWYIANPSTSQPNTILGRARSSDGIRFTTREAFVHPDWFGPEFRFIRKAFEVSTPTGAYLYVTLDDIHNRTRVVRLAIRDPHLATPLTNDPEATRVIDNTVRPASPPRRKPAQEVTRLYRIGPTSPIPM